MKTKFWTACEKGTNKAIVTIDASNEDLFHKTAKELGRPVNWRNAAPELVEELDNVTDALETCMAHFGNRMPEADQHARNRLIEQARSILAKAKGEPYRE